MEKAKRFAAHLPRSETLSNVLLYKKKKGWSGAQSTCSKLKKNSQHALRRRHAGVKLEHANSCALCEPCGCLVAASLSDTALQKKRTQKRPFRRIPPRLERVTHGERPRALVLTGCMRTIEAAKVVSGAVVVIQPDVTGVELRTLRERIHVADLVQLGSGIHAWCRSWAIPWTGSSSNKNSGHAAHVPRLSVSGPEPVRSSDLPVHTRVPRLCSDVAADHVELLARVETADPHRTPGVRRTDVPARILAAVRKCSQTRILPVLLVSARNIEGAGTVLQAQRPHARLV